MSKYTDLAMERRSQFTPEGRPAWNCCQAGVSVFAQDAGYDEDACMKAATYFRGGMQIGSVCGAITGSLMALGMAGSLCRQGHFLQLPVAGLQLLGHCPQKGRHALRQGNDPMVFPAEVAVIAEPQPGLPFPHAHRHQGTVQHAALSLMAVDFRSAVGADQVPGITRSTASGAKPHMYSLAISVSWIKSS